MSTNDATSFEYPKTCEHREPPYVPLGVKSPFNLQQTPGALARKSVYERGALIAGECVLVFPSRPHAPEAIDAKRPQNLHFMIVDARPTLRSAIAKAKPVIPRARIADKALEEGKSRFIRNMSESDLKPFCNIARVFLEQAPNVGTVSFQEADPREVGLGGPRSIPDEHWHCIAWNDLRMVQKAEQRKGIDGSNTRSVEPGLKLWSGVLAQYFADLITSRAPTLKGYKLGKKFCDPIDNGARIHPEGGIVLEREKPGLPDAKEMAHLVKVLDTCMMQMHSDTFSSLTANYNAVQNYKGDPTQKPYFILDPKGAAPNWMFSATYKSLVKLMVDREQWQFDYHRHPAYSAVMRMEDGHFRIGVEPCFYAIEQKRNRSNQEFVGHPGHIHALAGISLTRVYKKKPDGSVDEESHDPRQKPTEEFIRNCMQPALKAILGEEKVRWRDRPEIFKLQQPEESTRSI